MDSLNVPLPAAVRREIERLRPTLSGFETVRETPTLVLKRFDGSLPAHTIESEVRLVLADTRPFGVRLDGFGSFEDPVTGPAPVVFLAVTSPGLKRVHNRLVDAFGRITGLEGEHYVPHITLARGGDPAALDRLAEVEIDAIEWTVGKLWFWDARAEERVGRINL